MSKKIEDLIYLLPCEAHINNQQEDIICINCDSTYQVFLKEKPPVDVENDWETYLHPAFDYPDPAVENKFVELNPSLIKFILKSIESFYCPNCDKLELEIVTDSRFDAKALYKSLQNYVLKTRHS